MSTPTPPPPPGFSPNGALTPPPVNPGVIRLEYSGYWILFESGMSKITLKVNGQPYGAYKFKQPFTLHIPAVNGGVTLDAKLGGMRSAHLDISVRPGTTERVLLEYNRAWGNIYFTHIPNPYNQQF